MGKLIEQASTLEASLYGRRMYDLMAAYWPMAESDLAGTGLPFFPQLETRISLRKVAERAFESGVRYVGYERV